MCHTLHNHSDKALLQACRQGNEAAWEQLVARYERLVYAIPLNYGLSRDEAADIAQNSFILLLQNLDSLRDNERLGGWLATVARRHSWRALAHRQREQATPAEELATLPNQVDDSLRQQREQQEQMEWVMSGLNQLDDRCRQLLLALYFEPDSPTYEAIAHQFNMRVGSIGPTRARCLARLKEILPN